MANIKEHKTELQVNYGWGLSLNMTGKYPAITKRIWDKLADAQAYVDLSTESAIAGLTLRVVNDTERNNGVYWVKQAAGEQIYKEGQAPSKNDPKHKNGILVKLADENDVHEDFVNVSGDTMTGTLNINGGNLNVTGNTSLKGSIVDIDANTKVDINTPSYNLTGTTTNMEGTNLTVKYDNVELSGKTVNVSGNTTVKVDTPLLNVDSEDITVDGNNLTVTEKNTTINSTDKFDANSNNVHISGATTNMEGTNLTVDYDNINLSGNTEINIDTPDLNISSEDVSVSGNNLTINETSSTTINSNESFTVNSNHVNISGKTDINIDGPKLDIDVTNTTIDGSSLIINEGDKFDVNSKLVHISGATTNMEGDTLNVEYKNINSTATTVVNNFSEENNNISTQNNKITNINTTATTQTQHVTNENDYFDNWNVSSTTINITGQTTNMSGNALVLDYKTINISGDTNIAKKLNVSGDTHLHSNLVVDKSTHIHENLTVDGNTNINKNLTVGGSVTIEGDIILPNGEIDAKLANPLTFKAGRVKRFTKDTYLNDKVKVNPDEEIAEGDNIVRIPTKTSHVTVDSIKIIKETESETQSLGANVRESYRLVEFDPLDGGKELKQLGDKILVYKDSAISQVKLGKNNATVNENTGVLNEPGGGEEVDDVLLIVYHLENGKYSLVKINVEDFLRESEFYYGLEIDNSRKVRLNLDETSEDYKYFTLHETKGLGLSGITEAINKKGQDIDNVIKDLDLPQVGSNGNYIKFVSQLDGQVSATAQTFDTVVNSGSNNDNAPTSKAVWDIIDSLDLPKVGADGKYIKFVSQTNGKVSAATQTFDTVVNSGSTDTNAPTSKAVNDAINNFKTTVVDKLDLSQVGADGSYIKFVSQSNGQVSATKQAFDTSLNKDSINAPQTKVVKSEIDKINTEISNVKGDYVKRAGDTMYGNLVIGTGSSSSVTPKITLSTNGTINATGAIYSSDKKLKKDIELISQKDIESVSKVDLKSYRFKDDETNRERYGVIAQELEDANLTNLVTEDINGKKGVDYISFLILKIAQLEQEIKELKNR